MTMSKQWNIPKPCPYCKHEVNYPDSSGIEGYKNFCPNCTKQIVYSVPLGSMDYRWDKPTMGYGAMQLLDIEVASGEKGL